MFVDPDPDPDTTIPPTTTYGPETTTRKPRTTTHRPYTTTRQPVPTTQQQPTTSPPEAEHCYGHFTYKEDHNIIIDGEDDRHKDALECELACTVSKSNTPKII